MTAKFMPKPESHFDLDSVNTLRQDNTGILGFFEPEDGVPQWSAKGCRKNGLNFGKFDPKGI